MSRGLHANIGVCTHINIYMYIYIYIYVGFGVRVWGLGFGVWGLSLGLYVGFRGGAQIQCGISRA